MAASPGAFSGVRFFGALNSGERENVFPASSGRVWPDPAAPIDFSVTLEALSALVSRDLVPFVNLSFFPAAVSPSPTQPPDSFERWQTLVGAFLDAVVARFGAEAVADWWFEGWNEPNMRPFWGGSFERYLDLYRATSEAVLRSGHRVRLGGPALAYMPDEGRTLMGRLPALPARRTRDQVRLRLLPPQGHLGRRRDRAGAGPADRSGRGGGERDPPPHPRAGARHDPRQQRSGHEGRVRHAATSRA